MATVGFRVEPGGEGSGITYQLEVKLGSLPLPLHRTIEETIGETLKQGHGALVIKNILSQNAVIYSNICK